MIFVIIGTIAIGVIYAIVNMILMPYLITVFGNAVIPSQLVSAGMIIAAVSSVAIGIYIDRTKKSMPFVMSIAVIAFISTFLITSSSRALIGIGAVLISACSYSFLTPYSSLVSSYSKPREYDRNFGYVMGTVNATTFVISILISSVYIGSEELTFKILGLLVVLPLIPTMVFMWKNSKGMAVKVEKTGVEGTLNDEKRFLKRYPVFISFLLMQFGVWFFLGGLFPYFTHFLDSETVLGLDKAVAWFGAFTLFTGIISFTTGYFTKRIRQNNLLCQSLLLITVMNALTGFLYNYVVKGRGASVFALITFVLCGAALAFYYSLNMALVAEIIQPRDIGKAFGINSVFMIVSQAISISVAGDVIDRFGFRTLFFIFAAALLLADTGLFGILRWERKFKKADGIVQKA